MYEKKPELTNIKAPKNEKVSPVNLPVSKLRKYFPCFRDKKLQPKQIKFIVNYVENGFDKKAAYNASGYKAKNEASAAVCVHNILKCEVLITAMRSYIDERLGDMKLTLDKKLIDTLYYRAFYDVTMFYDEDGQVKNLHKVGKTWRLAIDGIETKYYGKDADRKVKTIKLADRDKALDLLSKYINLIKEDVNINLSVSKETEDKLKNIFENPEIN